MHGVQVFRRGYLMPGLKTHSASFTACGEPRYALTGQAETCIEPVLGHQDVTLEDTLKRA
jgi:hypothetical protein